MNITAAKTLNGIGLYTANKQCTHKTRPPKFNRVWVCVQQTPPSLWAKWAWGHPATVGGPSLPGRTPDGTDQSWVII
jgi:hypothetical protein